MCLAYSHLVHRSSRARAVFVKLGTDYVEGISELLAKACACTRSAHKSVESDRTFARGACLPASAHL